MKHIFPVTFFTILLHMTISQPSACGTVECGVRFDAASVEFSTFRGCDVVSMEGLRYSDEVGHPQLPVKTAWVVLDGNEKVSEISVKEESAILLGDSYLVVPVQEPLPKNSPRRARIDLLFDRRIYDSSSFLPETPVALLGHGDLAGQHLAVLSICPFRYNPVTCELHFIPEMTITLETTDASGERLFREAAPAFSPRVRAIYGGMLENMALNPERIDLVRPPERDGTLLPPLSCEHVIITIDDWADDFQPLADWHTRKGIPNAVVTREWISNNYPGSSTEAKIRNFVEDAYTTWGTVYVLLGGDTDNIGSPSKRINNYSVYSDYYYADFDEDWIAEVAVGRATVDNTSQILTFLQKTMSYERTPYVGDGYPASAFFFAFDLDRDTQSEICKGQIDDTYIPDHFKPIATEYDSEPGTHKTDSINYLNHGYNLVNHDDHADATSLGVGAFRHWQYLNRSDAANLSNGEKQSVLYSTGCHGNDYMKNEGIGEEFVRNSNGGCVGYVGNTHLGWYVPGGYNSMSFLYDKAFFKSIFTDNVYHQGMTLLDSKNDHFPGSGTYKHIWWELCLLGDPALPIWTDIPVEPTVAMPLQVNPGQHYIVAQLARDGVPAKEALICITDGGDIYENALTSGSGAAVMEFEDLPEGSMLDLTVTVQNCFSYGAEIEVREGPGLALSVLPEPSTLQRGDTLTVAVEVYNSSENMLTFDYWADLTVLPVDITYPDNPVYSVGNLKLPAGQSGNGEYIHIIPQNAPFGTYTYTCRVGSRPEAIWDEQSFTFEIVDE